MTSQENILYFMQNGETMPATILIVDDERGQREILQTILEAERYETATAAGGQEALALLDEREFDVILTDLKMQGMSGMELLERLLAADPQQCIIMMTAHGTVDSAVEAMKKGAFDYLEKPLERDTLLLTLRRAVERVRLLKENRALHKKLEETGAIPDIIGEHPKMKEVFRIVTKIAPTASTVLIQGESGTGKELVAKAIHFNGGRRDKPFIAVHCGAIPENLLESELFGYVKGAFTGAMRDKIGKFEAAHGGTIFLDEIGTMPMQLQTKLLRVLQEEEVERVGSTRPVKIDVRIISATNLDLAEEVRKGNFRDDLFYRLNVIPLQLPPLRERVEDILPLAKHFLAKYCKEMQRRNMSLASDTLEALESYQWPGNVRELENVMERVAALTEDDTVTLQDLPHNVREEGLTRLTGRGVDLVKVLAEIERGMIRDALALSDGVKARAAALLNLNRTTLVEKMRRLGMPL